MLQKVIDYEFKTIQRKVKHEQLLYDSRRKATHYSKWRLHQTISKVPDFSNFELLFVGHDSHAHILGLFYCLALGCLQHHLHDDLFLKLKFHLYSLCSDLLPIESQKVLVENMCLLQYSNNILNFLRRATTFEKVLVDLFLAHRHQTSRSNSIEKMEELNLYVKELDLVEISSDGSALIKIAIAGEVFYLAEEKDLWFILSPRKITPASPSKLETQEGKTYEGRNNSKVKQGRGKKNLAHEGGVCEASISPSTPISPQTNEVGTPKFLPQNSKKYRSTKNIGMKPAIKPFQELLEKPCRKQKQIKEKLSSFSVSEANPNKSERSISTEKSYFLGKSFLAKGTIQMKKTNFGEREVHQSTIVNPEGEGDKMKRGNFVFQSLGVKEADKVKELMEQIQNEKKKPPKFLLDKKRNQSPEGRREKSQRQRQRERASLHETTSSRVQNKCMAVQRVVKEEDHKFRKL